MDYETYLARCKDLADTIDRAEADMKASGGRDDLAGHRQHREARERRSRAIVARDRLMGNYWGSRRDEQERNAAK